MVLWQAVRAPRARATLHLTYIHAHTLSLHIEVCDPMRAVCVCPSARLVFSVFTLFFPCPLLLLLSSSRRTHAPLRHCTYPTHQPAGCRRSGRSGSVLAYRIACIIAQKLSHTTLSNRLLDLVVDPGLGDLCVIGLWTSMSGDPALRWVGVVALCEAGAQASSPAGNNGYQKGRMHGR